MRDHAEVTVEKEYYLSLVDVPTRHKIRELTTHKIGTLVRISGQVSTRQLFIPYTAYSALYSTVILLIIYSIMSTSR